MRQAGIAIGVMWCAVILMVAFWLETTNARVIALMAAVGLTVGSLARAWVQHRRARSSS